VGLLRSWGVPLILFGVRCLRDRVKTLAMESSAQNGKAFPRSRGARGKPQDDAGLNLSNCLLEGTRQPQATGHVIV
jgi:hypothetical protein